MKALFSRKNTITSRDVVNIDKILASLELNPPSVNDLVRIIVHCQKERNASFASRLLDYLRTNGLDTHASLGNHVVMMLVNVGHYVDAQTVFDQLRFPNECSWNALIGSYASHGECQHAIDLYYKMQGNMSFGLSGLSFVALLKACIKLKQLETGKIIYLEIAKKGFVEDNLFIANTLVDMYAKCASVAEAQKVFDNIPFRDVVLWTALISGYAEHGCGEEALNWFFKMQADGFPADSVTFVCGLKACGNIKSTIQGQNIHSDVLKRGFEGDLQISNSLLDMYANCGCISDAQHVFDDNLCRSVVSWNAMITAFQEHDHGEAALHCFEQMHQEGMVADSITFVCALKACGNIGAVNKGQELHVLITTRDLERDLVVGSTLVFMYAKCGWLSKAEDVFSNLQDRDVVSWTALIAGYAQRGDSSKVFHIYEQMVSSGVKPNLVTFLNVLSVCNHAGLVDKGRLYFESINRDHRLMPSHKHYSCFIDLLCRVGHFDEAISTIKRMPFHPEIDVWHTVLSACHKWGNVEVGIQAFEQAIRLDEKDAGSYICMCNIYVNAGMRNAADKIEALRVQNQAWKKPVRNDPIFLNCEQHLGVCRCF